MLNILWLKIQKWWQGEYIPPANNEPSNSIVIISLGEHKYPLIRRIYEIIQKNISKEWKYWLPVILALIGVIIAFFQFSYDARNKPNIDIFKDYIHLTYSNTDSGIIEFLKKIMAKQYL